LHRFTVWPRHFGRFQTLLAFDDIEFNHFFITYTSQVFLGVVLHNSSLVDKYVFLGVISVNETVTITDIEPFHRASDFCSYDIDNLF